MQENRSFDSYFGTYPGADGIPGLAGNPGTVPCIPDPLRHHCVQPYHDASPLNNGGQHGHGSAVGDINGGKMNGFIVQAEGGKAEACKLHFDSPYCSRHPKRPDVMGYHDWREIPNYWDYANQFVLQDHMFQSDTSWSMPQHLYLVSGWSAKCAIEGDPMSCRRGGASPAGAARIAGQQDRQDPGLSLDGSHVPLAQVRGQLALLRPERARSPTARTTRCSALRSRRTRVRRVSGTRCPGSTRCARTANSSNIAPLHDLFTALRTNTLPAVSWIVPGDKDSDHPPSLITHGQAYVTGLINSIMRSRAWNSTAIFLCWDDWGGFYDHVEPPNGRRPGLRTPRPRPRHQPLREGGLHRPPDPQPGRLPQVHRRRLPRRPATQPQDRRPARLPPRRPRERQDPREPARGLQLQPEAAGPADSAAPPAVWLKPSTACRCRGLLELGQGLSAPAGSRLNRVVFAGIAAACLVGLSCRWLSCRGNAVRRVRPTPTRLPDGTPAAIHKIRHVVIITQENRSFDSYFGTYPGADGIPGIAGNPGTVPCLPNPGGRDCESPLPRSIGLQPGRPPLICECVARHRRRQDERLRQTG